MFKDSGGTAEPGKGNFAAAHCLAAGAGWLGINPVAYTQLTHPRAILMQKLLKGLHVVDYVIGFGTIGYGLYSGSALFVAAGVLSLLLARLNLAQRLASALRAKLTRRAPVVPRHLAEDDGVELSAQPGAAPEAAPAARSYADNLLTAGRLSATASRHNLLLRGAPRVHRAERSDWA